LLIKFKTENSLFTSYLLLRYVISIIIYLNIILNAKKNACTEFFPTKLRSGQFFNLIKNYNIVEYALTCRRFILILLLDNMTSEKLNESTTELPDPCALPDEVTDWLKSFNFASYATRFMENGYDTLFVCSHLDENDLDLLQITRPGHRKALLLKSKELDEKRNKIEAAVSLKGGCNYFGPFRTKCFIWRSYFGTISYTY